MAKRRKGGEISTSVFRKICIALDYELDEVVEIEHRNVEY